MVFLYYYSPDLKAQRVIRNKFLEQNSLLNSN